MHIWVSWLPHCFPAFSLFQTSSYNWQRFSTSYMHVRNQENLSPEENEAPTPVRKNHWLTHPFQLQNKQLNLQNVIFSHAIIHADTGEALASAVLCIRTQEIFTKHIMYTHAHDNSLGWKALRWNAAHTEMRIKSKQQLNYFTSLPYNKLLKMCKISPVHLAIQRSLPAIMRQFHYKIGAIYVQHGTDTPADHRHQLQGGIPKILPEIYQSGNLH